MASISVIAESRSPIYAAWWSADHPFESIVLTFALQSSIIVFSVMGFIDSIERTALWIGASPKILFLSSILLPQLTKYYISRGSA